MIFFNSYTDFFAKMKPPVDSRPKSSTTEVTLSNITPHAMMSKKEVIIFKNFILCKVQSYNEFSICLELSIKCQFTRFNFDKIKSS